MRKAMIPGTFDPVTKGHLDIIERSSKQYDEVVVAIMQNSNKRACFTEEERVAMIEHEVAHLNNVKVVVGHGLSVETAKQNQVNAMIRGIRATSDYEYEVQIATANMMLANEIETVFLLSKPEYSFVSSSTVKEIAMYHGDLFHFVTPYVQKQLEEKFK